jgi:hypothetical protein
MRLSLLFAHVLLSQKCKVDYETTVHTAYVEKWLANANEFPQVS